MKMTLLIFTFLITSTHLICQTIPNKANVILVSGVTFDEVVNRILDSGFVIDKVNKDFKTITTLKRDLCKKCGFYKLIINARIKDSVAEFTGFFGNDANEANNPLVGVDTPISNYWINRKNPNSAFNIMNRIALSFSKPVTYEVR